MDKSIEYNERLATIQKTNTRLDKINEKIIDFTRELIVEFPELKNYKVKRKLEDNTFSISVGVKNE